MLTNPQYEALRGIRDSFVPAIGKQDDMTMRLCECGYIRARQVEYTVQDECEVTYLKSVWELTLSGRQALDEFEELADSKRRERAEQEADQRADRKFQTKQTILNAVVCAVVGAVLTLLFEHRSSVVSFIFDLFG